MQREVILSGPTELHPWFQEVFPEWNFQQPVHNVEGIWDGLENETLSTDSSIVIMCDTLYEEEAELFSQTAAELAPNALLLVLSYNSNLVDDITADIQAQPANLEYRKQYGQNLPVTFIPYDIAVKSIEEAVDYYDNHEAEIEAFQRSQASAQTIDVDAAHADHHTFGRDGKVFTVTSSKGGSGKSTVALLTGSAIALSSQKAYEEGLVDEPLRVCVVDLDTFDGQLGFVLNQSMPTSLNIALANTPMDEELVWNNLIYSERMGFHALLAPVRGVTARYTDGRFYTQVVDLLKKMFDVVILDTSVQHYDEIIKQVALPMADAILLVTTLDIKSVKGMARWLKVAAEPVNEGGHGIEMSKVGIVVNSSMQGVGIGQDELMSAAMGAPNLAAIPLDTTAVQAAGNAGRLEELLYVHQPISSAYNKLSNKIVNVLPRDKKMSLPNLTEEEEPLSQPSRPAGQKPSDKPKKKGGFFRR